MKRKSFTLIELIAVIAIISIVSSIILLRFDIIDKIGFENEVKTFVNDYNYARQKAISSGVTTNIELRDSSYTIFGNSQSRIRNLKFTKVGNGSISLKESGHVSGKTNITITSASEKQKTRFLTISAIGGDINGD